jgi:hypothetical protein
MKFSMIRSLLSGASIAYCSRPRAQQPSRRVQHGHLICCGFVVLSIAQQHVQTRTCICECPLCLTYLYVCAVTVTVTGNLLNTKALTLVSRQLSQPVQSPSDMRYRPPDTR